MAMQDIEDFENSSDEEYLPRDSEFDSDDSDIGQNDDSDHDLLTYEPVALPILDDGWHFMSNPFSDARPDSLPSFSGPVMFNK